jgi:ubiquinone/menaquinone biosynthesis C-methylase UbiE
MQKARTRWIETVPPPKRVLTVGEGTGDFLRTFVRVHRNAVVDCVDTSARMLQSVRLHISGPVNRVRFFNEDILSWTPLESYDLLVTNFVLDCFPRDELELVVGKLAGVATPGAYWLLAEFCIPKTIFARTHAKIWLATLYWFFERQPAFARNDWSIRRLNCRPTDLSASSDRNGGWALSNPSSGKRREQG